MKLSCTDAMVPGGTLTEKCRKLREWGFEGIAIFMNRADWSQERLEEILHLRDRTGVQPCEFVLIDPVYGRLMDRDPVTKRAAIDMYKETIRICGKIGALTEMEYEYRVQDPLPLFDPYRQMPEDEERRFLEVVQELSAEAGTSGAFLLLEPCNRYETRYLTTLSACRRIVEKAGSPRLGVLADFFHMSIEEADLSRSIAETGAVIMHVHLGDSNRLLPGYGHTDWHSSFRALRQIGFKGFMNLECGIPGPAEAELPKVAGFLKSMIARA